MLNIEKLCDYSRYSCVLQQLIDELGGIKVLRLNFESDYSGFVDIDVLLKDGSVFSYCYFYGSCGGCDDWEALELSSEEIKHEMFKESTIFVDLELYNKWRKTCKE